MENKISEKRVEEVLQLNNSRLKLAMQAANMAWWEMNITTGAVSFDKRKAEMLGYPPEKFKHYEDFMALVHPEDSEKAMNAMRGHLEGKFDKYEVEYRILTQSGDYKWFHDIGSIVKRDAKDVPLFVTGLVLDISERKRAEEIIRESTKERERLIQELQYALANIKTLQGLIPICANCKKIRDDKGFWNQLEAYFDEHTDAKFSHGICPECKETLYGDIFKKRQ